MKFLSFLFLLTIYARDPHQPLELKVEHARFFDFLPSVAASLCLLPLRGVALSPLCRE
jgi:hypothetical protein